MRIEQNKIGVGQPCFVIAEIGNNHNGSMELARRQVIRQLALARTGSGSGVSLSREAAIPWLTLTVLLGLSFLIGQWTVWRELAASGVYVSTNPGSSFF